LHQLHILAHRFHAQRAEGHRVMLVAVHSLIITRLPFTRTSPSAISTVRKPMRFDVAEMSLPSAPRYSSTRRYRFGVSADQGFTFRITPCSAAMEPATGARVV